MVYLVHAPASWHLEFESWFVWIDSDHSGVYPSSTSDYSNSLSNKFAPTRGSQSCHVHMFGWAIWTLTSPWSSPESASYSQSDEADRYCGATLSIWCAGIRSWWLSSLLLHPWRPAVGVAVCHNGAGSPQKDSCSSCQLENLVKSNQGQIWWNRVEWINQNCDNMVMLRNCRRSRGFEASACQIGCFEPPA